MSHKYTEAHKLPLGPGDARPTALQVVQDEGLEGKLDGKVILITGCSSGLGVQTARALYDTGATLYLTARDVKKARNALNGIIGSPRVHLLNLDLSSLASVRACANEFKSLSSTLNILIENAGFMACPEGRTIDGFETHIGINHLAHFLFFYLLRPSLLASSTRKFNSRVVILSSTAHQYSSVNFDNINLEGEYEPWKAYGQSKTANIWFANEIERLHESRGLHAFSVHPGGIRTELQRHVPEEQIVAWEQDKKSMNSWKSPEQGAATTVWAAISTGLEGKGGKYLEDCSIARPNIPENNGQGTGYAVWAYDPPAGSRLWERTMQMLNLEEEWFAVYHLRDPTGYLFNK